jgi:hypothetical protein
MLQQPTPGLPEGLVYFADWRSLLFGGVAILLIGLLIIWLSQQTRHWYRLVVVTFLGAFFLSFISIYLFEVPPYYVSCPDGCTGWRGYPLRVAQTTVDGFTHIGLVDFSLNLLILWLIVLLAVLVGRLVGVGINWELQARRVRVLVIVGLFVIPWALLPRALDPPQPVALGEDLRLAVNAQRAAENTFGVTGAWVQRLALEDVRLLSPNPLDPNAAVGGVRSQVCLRGYTYFYLPWRRYVVSLEPTGVTALSMEELPLEESCW